jgi:hypothetical protein
MGRLFRPIQTALILAMGAIGGCSGPDSAATPDSSPAAPDSGSVDAAAEGAPAAPTPDGSTLPSPDAARGPANSACGSPEPIPLVGDKGSAQGDSFGAPNQFGNSITCNSPLGPFPGPQLYYRVTFEAGKTYKLTLTPDKFDAALYLFPAGTACDAAAVDVACQEHVRETPDPKPYAGKAEAMLHSVQTTGDWVLVVDSYNPVEAGAFTLEIEPFTPPKNKTCAAAEPLTLGQKVTGDTIGADNEHSKVHCGEEPAPPSTKTPFYTGPQLYYSVNLSAGKKYRVRLEPGFFARLYLFEQTCSEPAIEAACASGGATGDAASVPMDGQVDLPFTPKTSGAHLVVVDSVNPILYGPFTLLVEEHSTPVLTAPASLDFESGCGGLAASGDWECGALAFKKGKNCTLGSKVLGTPPQQAHSGSGVWGTVLNDCYNGLGNNSKVDDKQGICTNLTPNDDSVLRFKVALPSGWTQATLSYWAWEDLNQPYDWAEIRVDKKVVWQLCEQTSAAPTAWKQRKLDLSAHVGKTVEVAFHFMASPYVNHAGWYIDDLTVGGS